MHQPRYYGNRDRTSARFCFLCYRRRIRRCVRVAFARPCRHTTRFALRENSSHNSSLCNRCVYIMDRALTWRLMYLSIFSLRKLEFECGASKNSFYRELENGERRGEDCYEGSPCSPSSPDRRRCNSVRRVANAGRKLLIKLPRCIAVRSFTLRSLR